MSHPRMPWVEEAITELEDDIRRHKKVPGYEYLCSDWRRRLAELKAMSPERQAYLLAKDLIWEEDLSHLPKYERFRLRRQKLAELQYGKPHSVVYGPTRYSLFDRLEGKRRAVRLLPVAKGPPIDPIGPWPRPKKPRKRRPHKPLFPTGTYDQKRRDLRLLIAKKRPQWKGRIAVYRNHITIYHLGYVYAPLTPDMTRLQLSTTLNRLDNLEREGMTPYGGAIKRPPASDTGSSG